jgi:hypothetical protein
MDDMVKTLQFVATTSKQRENPLANAIAGMMAYLPEVEEVQINVLLHAAEYWNWDLPDNRWEGLQPWLEGPAFPSVGPNIKKVVRKFNVGNPQAPQYFATFYHQIEDYSNSSESMERIVNVRTGFQDVSRSAEAINNVLIA